MKRQINHAVLGAQIKYIPHGWTVQVVNY